MTSAAAKVVWNCGDVVALAGSKGFGARVRAAVAKSSVPLHLLDGRFSAQAVAVVVRDPSDLKGVARQAAEAKVPVLSEQEALDAIALLNTEPAPGWCDCTVPVLPSATARSWEDHRLGACGWPERRCDTPQHRKSWCRACCRAVRLQLCSCNGAFEFSHDRDRDWWVHAVCGWPTRAWFESSGMPLPQSADGTPSWLWRIHQARSQVELSVRPLPDEVRVADLSWAGRLVED